MNLGKEKERDFLLAAHLQFDFSLGRWKKFWKKYKEVNPFQEKVFSPWQVRKARNISTWKEAMELSKSCLYKRISYLDKEYPESLQTVPSPPPVLYIQGVPIPHFSQMISVVGTRRPSSFGKIQAAKFSAYYARRGYGIVSGLAKGIDGIAHASALQRKTYTLAILGSGFEHLYPKENRGLAKKIWEEGGTVLSPYAPSAIPFPSYFPRRNGLIAALSAGTLMVEGAPQGGASITGRYALELGHSCVVLTQDFQSEAGKGAIELIRVGASPVCSLEESYEALAFPYGGRLPLLCKH